MKNLKRKLVALGLACMMVVTTSGMAMATEVATNTEDCYEVVQVNEKIEILQSTRASEILTISGSLSAVQTTGQISMPKSYSNITVFFAGKREDGSSSSATYQVELKNSRNEKRSFQMTLNGKGGYATVGSMRSGTWNYTIKRVSGTGTYAYAITFTG